MKIAIAEGYSGYITVYDLGQMVRANDGSLCAKQVERFVDSKNCNFDPWHCPVSVLKDILSKPGKFQHVSDYDLSSMKDINTEHWAPDLLRRKLYGEEAEIQELVRGYVSAASRELKRRQSPAVSYWD